MILFISSLNIFSIIAIPKFRSIYERRTDPQLELVVSLEDFLAGVIIFLTRAYFDVFLQNF